jgi:hypothetical protein
MTENSTPQRVEAAPAQPVNAWQRVKERKVVQWTLAYCSDADFSGEFPGVSSSLF